MKRSLKKALLLNCMLSFDENAKEEKEEKLILFYNANYSKMYVILILMCQKIKVTKNSLQKGKVSSKGKVCDFILFFTTYKI